MTTKIPIPEEFASQLRYVPAKDSRSDSEILASLTSHVPMTSEKNIWTYWHAGINAMPAWCQRNIINWVRLHGPDWTVRVLDTVPGSPNHALAWIAPEELPECFVKGTMTGPYTGPHSADFLRGAALYAYGGVWMDVGNIVFRNLDKVCWDQLADENSPYTISTPVMYELHMANHFIAARKGDIFIKHWHTLFMHLWKGHSDHTGIIASPLLTFVSNLSFSESQRRGYHWEFSVEPLTILNYIGQCVAWIRVALLKEPGPDGFDGPAYYARHVLVFDALREDWAAEMTVGFRGEDMFRVFTTRRDGDPQSEEFQRAYKCAWRLVTQSSLQKITHGKGLTHDMHAGALLDLEENQGKDCEEGTFGELLRYASVHLEQTRERIEYVEPEFPDESMFIHKGLLEP